MQTVKKTALVIAAAAVAAGASAGTAFASSGANGTAVDSPGVASGNVAQVPVHIPANVTGNTIDVIGALNPAFGNASSNN